MTIVIDDGPYVFLCLHDTKVSGFYIAAASQSLILWRIPLKCGAIFYIVENCAQMWLQLWPNCELAKKNCYIAAPIGVDSVFLGGSMMFCTFFLLGF